MLDVGRQELMNLIHSGLRGAAPLTPQVESCAENVDLDIQIWCVAQH